MNIDVFADFTRHLNTKKLSPRTVEIYLEHAHRFETYLREQYQLDFGDVHIHSIKGHMASSWATSLSEYKARTRNLYITSVRIFLQFLYRMQYVDFDLSTALPPPPNVKRYARIEPDSVTQKRGYDDEELARMIASIPDGNYAGLRRKAMIAVLLTTGLRASELAALNIGDVTSGSSFAEVPRKGTQGNKVKVPISATILPIVNDYLKERERRGHDCSPSSPLFISNRGNRVDRELIWHDLARMQKKAGCPTGVHTFRHTAATQAAKDENPIVARDFAGHQSIEVTNEYLHTTEAELIEAAEKLGERVLNRFTHR